MKLSKNAALFLALVLVCSAIYFVIAFFTLPPTQEAHGFWGEVGGGLGGFAGWALVLLYGRGILKLCLNKGSFLERLLPDDSAAAAAETMRQILNFLNKTHPYLGIFTIALLAAHAGLASNGGMNLFFILTMLVTFWQGGFGLFLKSKWAPSALRKHSYAVHAQLVTGGLILIFAGFGHLLVDG